MNFEERIDRLTERHEALAQSIELLTHDVRAIGARVDQLTDAVQKHDGLIGQILEATMRTQETVANLALIARVHSQRLDRLEGH